MITYARKACIIYHVFNDLKTIFFLIVLHCLQVLMSVPVVASAFRQPSEMGDSSCLHFCRGPKVFT